MAAENCEIKPTDTIAIWGCGPVGLLTIRSAFLQGAKRVIAVDTVPERLQKARDAGAETIDYAQGKVQEEILEKTAGQGPDATIEAVGMESHGAESLVSRVVSAVQSTVTAIERPFALDQAIIACRPGGIVSVPGVYVGPAVPIAMGAFMNKGLTMKTGQTHMLRYMEPLLKRIEEGQIDPSFVITHKASLEQGPELYKTFRDKKEGCVKVVMRPHG